MIRNARQSTPAQVAETEYQALKTAIHTELVESLDLAAVGQIHGDQMRAEVRELTGDVIKARRLKLTPDQLERLYTDIDNEVFGLGPLEALMADPTISDILVNGAQEVYVERRGRMEKSDVVFADDDHVMRIIQRIVARISRRVDEVSPLVDARLPDGSRVNAVIPPLALDGPKLSIRRFAKDRLHLDELLEGQSLSSAMSAFLEAAVAARVSFMISGGTGAGKTTLLNALSGAIPDDERIVTIEDSAELLLQNPHVVRMETRPANSEGTGEFTQRDLVKNSLRMRPDRIIVGEVRGPEALDMLQAMNTGHEGSLTTIHANDARDALARLEMMVAMSGFELPVNVVRNYVAAGIGLVVHVARLKGGVRRITRIAEIVSSTADGYVLEDVFRFRQQGLDEQGAARGEFYATGYTPRCLERFADAGVEINTSLFTRLEGE
ncbi:CpaF family protein [Lignipirellula cremea]|uniref:Conjugal transfer protein n=1 Tax=Lignipirellula cremea TaxID=2528010 RepID=A0A518E533_9BACT|nr:CpaF family protein [Lignipirellula cremea]QDU99206.1 Putative conjugal transfer protein [Lignipirellula cremea]